MNDLVDLHSHILPGLDDGPDDLEDALLMLEALKKLGFGRVFATPHYRLYTWEGIEPETVEKEVRDLSWAAGKQGIGIQLLAGMEFDLDETLPDRVSDIPGGAGHILVDVGFWGVQKNLVELLGKVMDRGVTVLLVHPERNRELCRHGKELSALMASGVKLLGNIGSFSGMYGRKVRNDARKLLKRGYYWAAASDMHSHEQFPWIRDGMHEILSRAGDSRAEEMLVTRPMQLVQAMEGDG